MDERAVPTLTPRYNIAPGLAISIVRIPPAYGYRVMDQVWWGLIPPWAKDKKIRYKTINARAETVAEKPAYRAAFRRTRVSAYMRCVRIVSAIAKSHSVLMAAPLDARLRLLESPPPYSMMAQVADKAPLLLPRYCA